MVSSTIVPGNDAVRGGSRGEDVLLSVVMPAHDVAPWIGEALDCVLGQGVDGMEVVVVDDHSADGTRDVVARYAASDPRVTLVKAVGRGGGTARNLGAERARGKYLVFCDGDDIVPDGAYAALVASLEESGSDIAFGDYLKFRPVDTWRPTDRMAAFSRAAQGTTLAEEPTLLYSRPCWNKAFSRRWWQEQGIRFPDVPRSNDIVPMVTAYLRARRVDILPDVVYLYRERPGEGSMTARADSTSSMLSYLAQELACARAVASAHDPRLDEVYASLVHDRDGYVHVVKYLAGSAGRPEDDEAVGLALAELLAETPPAPAGLDPVRRAIVQLTARGEAAAARTLLAAVGEAGPRPAQGIREQLAEWTRALDRLGAHGLAGPEAVPGLVNPLTVVLTRPLPAVDVGAWRTLVETAQRVLGDRIVMLVPEARVGEAGIADALAARRRAEAVVTRVRRAGDGVVLEGRSVLGRGEAEPVLHDGEFAGAAPVVARGVDWARDAAGGWLWRATFDASTLPMHRPLAPALRVVGAGVAVAMRGDCAVPEYRAKDRLLYDQLDGILVIRRRRHWLPRAARRGAVIAGGRVARRLGRS